MSGDSDAISRSAARAYMIRVGLIDPHLLWSNLLDLWIFWFETACTSAAMVRVGKASLHHSP